MNNLKTLNVIEQLRNHFAFPDADYPYHLIEEILENRELATPKLLELVDELVTCSPRNMTDEQWYSGMVALYILAKFREQKAFPYLVRLCSLPETIANEILGDVRIDNLGRLLASTFNGDWKTLYSLVTNKFFDQFSRAAVLEAYIVLYNNKEMSREEIIKVFADLFIELYDDYSIVPTSLVLHCCPIHATELRAQIKKYFAQNVVILGFLTPDDVNSAFLMSRDFILEELSSDPDFSFINNLEDDMQPLFRDEDDFEDDEEDAVPFVYSKTSVGRNELCPCGSGKKYKKCCCTEQDSLPF